MCEDTILGTVGIVEGNTLSLRSRGGVYLVTCMHPEEFTPGEFVCVSGLVDGTRITRPTLYRVFPVSH